MRAPLVLAALILAVLILALAGCSALHAPPPDPIAPLLGTEWVADDLGGRGVVANLQSTLRFDAADKVSGRGGCNRYAGPLTQQDGEVHIGPLAGARIACPPAVMDQEVRFLIALQKVRRIELREGDKLVLLDDTGAALITMSR